MFYLFLASRALSPRHAEFFYEGFFYVLFLFVLWYYAVKKEKLEIQNIKLQKHFIIDFWHAALKRLCIWKLFIVVKKIVGIFHGNWKIRREIWINNKSTKTTRKSQGTDLFLVRIFLIRTEYGDLRSKSYTGKYRPEITPYLDTFHAVRVNSSVA